MSAQRFLWTMFGAILAATLPVAAFNVVVDPYLVFDRPRVAGFNALKPAVDTHERLMKAYQSSRVEPRTVIMGSSRAAVGMNPDSDLWPPAMRPVYNQGIVGAGLDASLSYLRILVDRLPPGARPRTLVVGLDFESFLRPPPAGQGQAAAVPAGTAPAAQPENIRIAALSQPGSSPLPPRRVLEDSVAAALTLDAVLDSLSTLWVNHRAVGIDLAPSGRLSDAKMSQWTHDDGVAALFGDKERWTISKYLYPHQTLSDSPQEEMHFLSDLDALLDLARRNGMTVMLNIQLAHATHLDLMTAMGYWPDYERWKQELLAHAAAGRRAGLDVDVWDFGGCEPYAFETVPAPGDRIRVMRWFWDPVHYRQSLGDEMIRAMTGQPSLFPTSARMTQDTQDEHFAETRRACFEITRISPVQYARNRQLLCDVQATGGSRTPEGSASSALAGCPGRVDPVSP